MGPLYQAMGVFRTGVRGGFGICLVLAGALTLFADAAWWPRTPEAAAQAAGECHRLDIVNADGDPVVGAEDLAVDRAAGQLYVSAYDRRLAADQADSGDMAAVLGGIYTIPLNKALAGGRARARRVIGPAEAGGSFRPHGFDLDLHGAARRRIAVINRGNFNTTGGAEINGGDGRDSRIERYEQTGERGGWRRRDVLPADERLCSPNDIAIAGADRLFVTSDRGSCSGLGRLWEDMWGLARSRVFEYSGGRFRPLEKPLAFANGVAIMRDGEGVMNGLAVAATRADEIAVFGVEPDGAISPQAPRAIDLPSGPDNLSVAGDGTLIAALHPNLFRYALFRAGLFGTSRAPSQIVRIRRDPIRRGWRYEPLFRDDGRQISGATSAVVAGGRLIIGAGYDDHLLVCRLDGAGR